MDEFPMPDETPSDPEVTFKAIVVTDTGPQKIRYISLLRRVTKLDLRTAKEVAELDTPHVLAVCDETAAAAFQEMATAAGAVCELADYDESTESVIPHDQPFDPLGAGKTGCATAALLLVTSATGLIYGLALLAGRM